MTVEYEGSPGCKYTVILGQYTTIELGLRQGFKLWEYGKMDKYVDRQNIDGQTDRQMY